MKLTVSVNLPTGSQFLHQDFDPSFTLGDLKLILLDSTLPDGFPEHTWLLHHNEHALTSDKDSQSLQAVGIKDDDMLQATPQVASQAQRAPPRQDMSQEGQIEQLRQHFLGNPQARSELRQRAPQMEELLDDAPRFVEAWSRAMAASNAQERLEDQALDDDVNEENQAKILDRIRRERIQKDIEDIIETSPELLGRVTMLYISLEVNGHPVKAFVDSGAQATIISPSCAEACGLTHLIDERWTSVARGVGTAKILGRIHKAPVKIGYDELPCSFTVLEGKDVDMLFGLDMLKRYQASINLYKNCLEFPGGQSVPFLPENELPRAFEDEPVVEGPGGAKMGAESGAIKSPGAAVPSGSQVASKQSNFKGAGQSLGAGPSSSSAPPPRSARAPAQPPARPSRPTPASGFPDADIQSIVNIGASREQAIAALQSCNGNVDMAASLIFDSL